MVAGTHPRFCLRARRFLQTVLVGSLLVANPIPAVDRSLAGADEPVAKKPAVAALRIQYDIPGAEKDARFFVESRPGGRMIGSVEYGPMKFNPLRQGETLTLEGVEPGNYTVARYRQLEIDSGVHMHRGFFLDRRQLTLPAGEQTAVEFVRSEGTSVEGRISGFKPGIWSAVVVSVCSPDVRDAETKDDPKAVIYDACLVDKMGGFRTEPIVPGEYVLFAEAYEPLPQEAHSSTGSISPKAAGLVRIKTLKGEVQRAEIPLKLLESPAN